MSRRWMFLAVAAAVMVRTNTPASAQDFDVEQSSEALADSGLIIGSPVNAGLAGDISSCPTCPKLYNNTSICTVNVQGLAVGGATPDPMSLLDWIVTTGGNIVGFDIFFVNSGSAVVQPFQVNVYSGTNADRHGQLIPEILFRTTGAPALMGIPAWNDPNTGRPGLIRATINYTTQNYKLTGLSEDPDTGNLELFDLNGPTGQNMGSGIGRQPFTLPAGEVGVQVRLISEPTICNSSVSNPPKAGPAMAGGGAGSEDGLHIIGNYSTTPASACQSSEYGRVCANPLGWSPFINEGTSCLENAECAAVLGPGVFCRAAMDGSPTTCHFSQPCIGGDVCNLDRPFYGIALTLYIGPGEPGDGNNDIPTADPIAAPAAGSGNMAMINGFIGDNGTPCDCEDAGCVCTEMPLFDADPSTGAGDPIGDGDVDLLDWRDFQRCFNRVGDATCNLHDANGNDVVDASDYTTFVACAGQPEEDAGLCVAQIPPTPDLLADVDLYRITGLTQNHVVSILAQGSGNSDSFGAAWDPFIRVFSASGQQIPFLGGEGGESDDYERFSQDAFTTVKVPAGTNSLYVGVSNTNQIIKIAPFPCDDTMDCQALNEGVGTNCGTHNPGLCDLPCMIDQDCVDDYPGFPANATCGRLVPGRCDLRLWYDPADASTISPLMDGASAGGYTLSVSVTNPASVTDPGGNQNTCYERKHEPDDTLADATARGAITSTIVRGAIGDGAFGGIGQCLDLFRVELDGAPLASTQNTRSFTADVSTLAGLGFQTVFDLVLVVYDSDGELIATGDQNAREADLDQSRPLLGVNVCGSTATNCFNPSSEPGLYYLGIFGTDRRLFNDAGNPLTVAGPPSILNFPHGTRVAATQCSDLRPFVGGRVNKPGDRLIGREPPDPNTPPNDEDLQCYRIVISTSTSVLSIIVPDVDENVGANGNDAIPFASTTLVPGDRLATTAHSVRILGNGRYGGRQGDVDFYSINAEPGEIVSVNMCDNQQPPDTDNRIRSYLALYDGDGFVFATQDYSLERYDNNIFITDRISDEIAANIAGVVPEFTGAGNPMGPVYVMVGIDNGNLLQSENTPFDAFFPGTTLSRRFQTNVQTARGYRIGVTVLDPVITTIPQRLFAVVHRGVNAVHVDPYLSCPNQSTRLSFPKLVELDPRTGVVTKILNGESANMFTFREPLSPCAMDLCPGGAMACEADVSSNPVIAYDGTTLFASTEQCVAGAQPCDFINHPLFKINPNLNSNQPGFIQPFGNIAFATGLGGTISGMAEKGGIIWALNTTNNRIRFWNKASQPTADNGGISMADPMAMEPTNELIDLSGTDPDGTVFTDLDGHVGTDGTHLYIPCFDDGAPVGICKFTAVTSPDPDNLPNGLIATFTFAGAVDDPITKPALIPGPRLGGFDVLPDGTMIAADKNGTIIEYWNMGTDAVTGIKLPREFLVDRLSAR